MIKVRANNVKQIEAITYVNATYEQYKELLQKRHNELLEIYKEKTSFTQPKKADWSTTFKVNKMYEISNKTLPRIISKNPKRLVSSKVDLLRWVTEVEDGKQWGELEKLNEYTQAVSDYLTTVFDKYNLIEPTRIRAKNMVDYGVWFAKIKFKYDISRASKVTNKEEIYIDENGEEQVEVINKEVEEKVSWEYPTIEVVNRTDIFYDPRIKLFKDIPAVIEEVNNVRFVDIKRNKKDYINIDKLELINWLKPYSEDSTGYKQAIFSITWMTSSKDWWIDMKSLNIKYYYGLYDIKWNGDERLYKIWIVEWILCICFNEITQIPFEQIRCFEDTDTNISRGFLEPIMWLQKELNFKKNSTSEYINHALNRSWVRSPNSWINPKTLISKPNNIIPTTKNVEEAMSNLQELPNRDINPSYFQEQNDFERQIQGLSFTVDTSNQRNAQALTNTATGARIKFYESNVVLDQIRRQFEAWLVRLAYKLLNETFENMDNNIVISKLWDTGFWEMNKELIRDAVSKYEIKIESWSSSLTSIEDRREEALSKYNLWLQAMQSWVPVDMEKLFIASLDTFENTDWKDYIKQQPIQGMWWMWGWGQLEQPIQAPEWPAQLTKNVAQWNIQGL